jgi:hypothetical protein
MDGLAGGMQSGAKAAEALRGSLPAGGGGAANDNSRSVKVDVHVGGIAMHGVIGLEDFVPLLESQVADVFERVALELGQ